jgi:hypothetical protein
MRTYIYFSKTIFLALFVLALGILLVYVGEKSTEAYEGAIELSELTAEDCVDGQYVKGTIDSYLVKTFSDPLGTSQSGQCCSKLTLLVRYDTYNIPTADKKYLQVELYNRAKVNALEDFRDGKGAGVEFEGVIVQQEISNPEWYDGIDGFKEKQLIKSTVLKERDIKSWMKLKGTGMMTIIMGAFLFITSLTIERSGK